MNNERINKIVKLLDDKKAVNISVLDITGLTTIADYFIIATGNSLIQVKALCDHLEKEMAKEGVRPNLKEGYNTANWILLDYDGIVVHIFYPETRDFYKLEHVWHDAKDVDVSGALS